MAQISIHPGPQMALIKLFKLPGPQTAQISLGPKAADGADLNPPRAADGADQVFQAAGPAHRAETATRKTVPTPHA